MKNSEFDKRSFSSKNFSVGTYQRVTNQVKQVEFCDDESQNAEINSPESHKLDRDVPQRKIDKNHQEAAQVKDNISND